MLSRTQALIRLAQVFDESGLHSTADIVDGRMWRIALDMSDISPKEDETTEKYRSILNREYRNRFKIKPGDSNFTSYRNEESYWVLPDGSTILLDGIGHGDAIEGIEHKTKSDNGVRLSKDPEYQEFKNRYWDSYHMVSNTLGAIRVYAEMGNRLVVTAYTVPTQQQLNTIDNLKQYWSTNSLNIEQFGHVLGGRQRFTNIPEWEIAVEKYERASKASGGVSPQTSEFKNTINQVDETNQQGDEPYWKSMERRRLEEQYPGEANAPLRKMYERSAGTRTASREDYYRQALGEGHKAKFKVLEPEEPVEQFRNMHSFWLYPDGRVMDLGKQWHEDAFNSVMQEAGLDAEEEFGKMYSSKDGPHEIMSDYFGMIRLFIQDKNSMVVTSYRKPTQAQIDQIQNISQQSGRGVIKIEQYGYVNGGRLVTNSMAKWIDELGKYRPDAEGQSSYNTMRNNIDETNDTAKEQPYWKARERQNLETTYPGPENEQLRKMYERSASNGC